MNGKSWWKNLIHKNFPGMEYQLLLNRTLPEGKHPYPFTIGDAYSSNGLTLIASEKR